eukprot:TRINITY_DN2260_c0_g1_i1.p1 TRINITY_DN2260_c0_g1~~TRINITY_DN2260_c0_g1_i1.p1  ORF type:complete len:540 (+),score=121.37 TRINITY_DN2260_c0_g1_i1:107-1726(+)
MDNKQGIFFGSLELREREKLERGGTSNYASNTNSTAETLPLSSKALDSIQRHKLIIEQIEAKKRARVVAVPTNDVLVRQRLRELDEPITLFGEKPEDRRARLRELLVKLGIDDGLPEGAKPQQQPEEPEQTEPFLTEGTPELKEARKWIADFSLKRASARIQAEKRKRQEMIQDPSRIEDESRFSAHLQSSLKSLSNSVSLIGDERPLSSISYSPDSSLLATSSWGGVCKVWDTQKYAVNTIFRGHNERVGHFIFHPYSTIGLSPFLCNLASCSVDNVINLWSLESQSNNTNGNSNGHINNNNNNNNNNMEIDSNNNSSDEPHVQTPLSNIQVPGGARVNRIAFHPSGRFLAGASEDNTWRLFDIETNTCLLEQEGHSRGVFAIDFQCDGSLVATGGKDALVRIWDTRSGRGILVLPGHVKDVFSLNWSPDAVTLATGSEDHTVRIWDIRSKDLKYVLPAHSALISCVKFQKTDGRFLVTGGFDKLVKVWNSKDWSPIVSLAGHEARITDVDISHDSKTILSSSFDRTWKLWETTTLDI